MRDTPVTIRATEPRVQGYLLDTLPEYLPEIAIIVTVSFQGKLLQFQLSIHDQTADYYSYSPCRADFQE